MVHPLCSEGGKERSGLRADLLGLADVGGGSALPLRGAGLRGEHAGAAHGHGDVFESSQGAELDSCGNDGGGLRTSRERTPAGAVQPEGSRSGRRRCAAVRCLSGGIAARLRRCPARSTARQLSETRRCPATGRGSRSERCSPPSSQSVGGERCETSKMPSVGRGGSRAWVWVWVRVWVERGGAWVATRSDGSSTMPFSRALRTKARSCSGTRVHSAERGGESTYERLERPGRQTLVCDGMSRAGRGGTG